MNGPLVEKEPAWKAWTYRRRLERWTTVNPEQPPPLLPGAVIISTLVTVLDIRCGRRTWRCIETFTTAEVQRILSAGPQPVGRIKKIRVSRINPWAVEVAAVIAGPDRCIAIAMRWDFTDAWTLTAIEG